LQQIDARIATLPIHLDSPMAEKVDDAFENHPEAHKPIPRDSAGTPFGIKNLTVHITADDSKKLNLVKGAHAIISSSGMASGGRVLHHLHNHLPDPKSTILFTGYQGAGTLGNLLTHNAHTVRILGDMLPVRATIAQIGGFSGHADQNELKHWLGTCTGKPHLYAVHGEAESAAALSTLARTAFGWQADVARRGTTVEV
jgi:metallo-beta-lactamase family protein